MAALARRWVGKGVSIVLRHAHELRGSFHRTAEAHRIHGKSSSAAMMDVTETMRLVTLVIALRLLSSHPSSSVLGIRNRLLYYDHC
jgi:hypothetical protein